MSPWELLGLILGWAAVVGVVVVILLLVVFMVLLVIGIVNKLKSTDITSNPSLRKKHSRE